MVPLASEAVRRTRVPAYVIATLVILVPLMEIGGSAWPYRISNPEWRLSLVSAAAAASTAILLGLLLIYVLGTLFDDRAAIWLVALIGALMTASCVTAGGFFFLDALELRSRVSPGSEGRFGVASSLALTKVFLAGFAALVIAVSAFRAGRNLHRASLRKTRRPAPVIVNSSSTAVPGGPL
jgi:hypothetical protein